MTSETRRRVFSILFGLLLKEITETIQTVLHHRGSEAEIVFRDASRYGERVFSMDCDCLRVRGPFDWTGSGDHCWYTANTSENAWNRLVVPRTVGFIEKPRFTHYRNCSNAARPATQLDRWQTDENHCTNFTRLYRVMMSDAR